MAVNIKVQLLTEESNDPEHIFKVMLVDGDGKEFPEKPNMTICHERFDLKNVAATWLPQTDKRRIHRHSTLQILCILQEIYNTHV